MRLHLVDGTYELYRAHFAPRPGHLDPSGRDAKATVGIVESILSLLHDADEAVTHIAVVFDNPIRSFRNDLYPPYKSDEGVPPELRSQFDAAEDAIRAIGLKVWSMREYEADDGIASGARRFLDEVEQVRILSPDKDLGQSIVGDKVVQIDRRQRKLTNESAFRAERGFAPQSMPDFLALTGDSADGFPGLPGFGKKSAGMLIGAYGHLEQIPALAHNWKVAPRGALQLATTLAEHRDEALLYRKLATLIDTVPLNDSLNDLRHRGVPRDRFERWCHALGAQRLLSTPRRWE
ncbi:MAG TPA: 5'-3' exonuclease H3TH domain-containing protein [Candidatus Binatus sp.]|nr:5'-3' exonuclease H3TH domain-containing protein [Candidatus Binatus sp.]